MVKALRKLFRKNGGESGLSSGRSLGVGGKLYASLGALMVLTTISSLISLAVIGKTFNLVDGAVKRDLVSVADSSEIISSFGDLSAGVSSIISAANESALDSAHEATSSVRDSIEQQVRKMPLSDDDKEHLMKLLQEVKTTEGSLYETKKSVISAASGLRARVEGMTALHDKLDSAILPVYDDAQFALLIELDDALSKGAVEAKAMVEEKTESISNMLKLTSYLNAINGIYLATHALSEPDLIVPFREKFVAASAQCRKIVAGFGQDPVLQSIAADTGKFLSFGDGENNVFDSVRGLLEQKQSLRTLDASINEHQNAVGAVFAKISATIKTTSVQSADLLLEQLSKSRGHLFGLAIFFVLFVVGLIFGFIRPKIVTRIKNLSTAMEEIRSGNLTYKIEFKGSDEIAQMGSALVRFKDDALKAREMEAQQQKEKVASEEDKKKMMRDLASRFESEVKGIVGSVAAASIQLSETAKGMAQEIGRSAATAQQASQASMETSQTVQSVATVVEELSASAREVSTQTQRTNAMVTDSVQQAESADKFAQTLSQATQRVKEVVELISNISGQINLLALNATIESARAGDAGKGFAVVANEVKNLASQTDNSIEEIIKVIESMDSASGDIINALTGIRRSVDNISEASSNVASVIEEQTAVTGEIASNMQTAARSVQVTVDSLTQVTGTATSATASAEQILIAAQTLSQQAANLDKQVDGFLNQIRA